MEKESLFRQEVIAARQHQHLGPLFINLPPNTLVFSLLAAGFLLVAALFLCCFDFAEKRMTVGYVNSTKGLIPVFSQKEGVVAKQFIHQGERVKKNDTLFLIDTSVHTTEKLNQLFKQQEKRLQAELLQKKNSLQQLKPLVIQHYVSLREYQQEKTSYLQIKNALNHLKTEIAQFHDNKRLIIRAPIDGTITEVIAHVGAFSQVHKPLLKILPESAALVAEIFFPVSEPYDIQKNQSILIQYDGYPYQRFGSYPATVEEVGVTLLLDSDEDKPILIHQPYYKVLARLSSPYLQLQGRKKHIQQGMTFKAIIASPKRKVWQWLLKKEGSV